MKKVKPAETVKVKKLIRINDYTWIEKRVNESEEVARQKFLLKLSKADNSHGSSDQVFN
jgi:hypothetical protein